MKFPGFIGGSFQPQAGTADNSRTVNMYVEPSQGPGATTEAALYPVPGVEQITEPVGGPTTGLPRAHFFQDGREFCIIDAQLYEIHANGFMEPRGDVADDRRPATISTNGDIGGQLFITSGRNAYHYTLSTNVIGPVAALAGLAFQGEYLDGYFLCLDDQTSTLYISNLADGSVWDTGTDFAQRSIGSDPWIAMKVCGRFLWLFGQLTTEVWYNTADTFPFAPHPSGLLNYGIKSPYSARVIGNDLVWFASTGTGRLSIVRGAGFTPQVISPYALDLKLATYIKPELAYADVYSDAGHTFYLLGFDSGGITWAYDTTTGIWCERMYWNDAPAQEEAYRLRFYARAFNQHRWLDRESGERFEMSQQYVRDVDNTTTPKRIRRCPAPFNENKRVFFSSLDLDVEPGLGFDVKSYPGAPLIMLRISNDGGKTWPIERWQDAGHYGNYKARVGWNRLGASRRRVFEVSMTDPAQWRITGAYLEAKAENG